MVGTGGSLSGSGITTSTDQTVKLVQDLGHEAVRVVSGARPRRRAHHWNVENVTAVLGDGLDLARAAHRHRPDVVWLHTFGVTPLPALRTLAEVICARTACRSVVVRFQAFGLEDHVARAGFLQRCTLRAIGMLSTHLVGEHDRATTALARFTRRGRAVTLGNWVEVPERPQPLPEGPPFVALFVGGLLRRKGLPELLEGMRRLAGRPMVLRVIGGPGDEGAHSADDIVASARDLVAAGTVEFLGQLDGGRVRQELAKAHVFVLPSRAEGMPLSLLEALAEGRAVVVSAAGNMREIVERHRCGAVVDTVDASAIAEAMASLVDRPDELTPMGERAHAAAHGRFSGEGARAQVAQILATSGGGSAPISRSAG